MAQKVQISVGQNHFLQPNIPGSAGIKHKELGAQTAVGGPRKHKLVPTDLKVPLSGQQTKPGSFLVTKTINSGQPLAQTQNLVKDSQQIFFEKRNRSRGTAATGTLSLNPNGTPIQHAQMSNTASKV